MRLQRQDRGTLPGVVIKLVPRGRERVSLTYLRPH